MEDPEAPDDAFDDAVAGRFHTWVKDDARITALREAAEGRHRGSWVHQRVMAEMLGFDSISELDDFFRSLTDDANDMVEHPIDVFDTSCDNDLLVHGVRRGKRIPGGSRVNTCMSNSASSTVSSAISLCCYSVVT